MRVLHVVLAVCALAGLCACEFKHDPAKTMTLQISGISTDEERKKVHDALKKMTDSGAIHRLSSTAQGNAMTVDVSPVTDVDQFVKRIDFGKVTDVKGRVVKVDYLRTTR